MDETNGSPANLRVYEEASDLLLETEPSTV